MRVISVFVLLDEPVTLEFPSDHELVESVFQRTADITTSIMRNAVIGRDILAIMDNII